MGWKRFFEVILVFLSSVSLTFCIGTYFEIDVSIKRAVIIIALLSLWFMAACINNKIMAVMVSVGIVAWGLYTYTNWEEILRKKDILSVVFPAVMVISIGIYKYKSSLVHIMITVVIASLFLITDLYSYEPVFFLWFATVIASRCMRREGGNFTSLVMLVLVFAILMLSQKYVSMPVSEIIKEHSSDVRYFQQKINMKLTNVFNLFGGRTNIDGELDNSNPGNNENTDIIVYMDIKPPNNIYLKGFVGDKYEGDGWSEISDEKFFEEFSGWPVTGANYQAAKMRLINEYYYRYYYNNNSNDVSQMKVELEGYSGNYVLYPYGVNLDMSYGFAADGEILRQNETIYSYSCRPVLKYNQNDYYYGDLAEYYRDYAYSNYLSTEKNLANLERVCREFDNSSFFTARNSIRNYLVTRCSYSTELEPVPYGVDFTEFFVFTQKKGYCTHFATASTLMFRIMGYPARYVTGYVVFPNDFVKNEDNGYTAVVTGNNAHAWTEVYLDGVWYPVETTPGYISTAPNYFESFGAEDNDVDEDQKENIEENQTEEEPAQEMKEDNHPKSQENKRSFKTISFLDALKFICRVMVYFCILAAFTVIRRISVIFAYRLYFSRSSPVKSVKAVTRYTVKMLCRAGYEHKKDMSDMEYSGYVMIEGFDEFIRIAQEACFSNHKITDDDAEYCIRLSRMIEKKLYGQMGKMQRFLWKYLYCYR